MFSGNARIEQHEVIVRGSAKGNFSLLEILLMADIFPFLHCQ